MFKARKNFMHIHRRQLLGLAAASSLSSLPQAFAQAGYPSKPITLVVPFAPGGAVDNSGRLIAERLPARLAHNAAPD